MTPARETEINEALGELRGYGAKDIPSVAGLKEVYRQKSVAAGLAYVEAAEDLWIAGYLQGFRMGVASLLEVQMDPSPLALEAMVKEGYIQASGKVMDRRNRKIRTLSNLFGLLP